MKLTLSLIYLFIGTVMFAIPNLTRRGILFGVPVPPHFRETPLGHRSIAIFRTVVATVVFATLCALLFSPEAVEGPVATAGPLIIILATGFSFFAQNRKLAAFAVQPSQAREADLTGAADRLPWFAWLGAGPFVILGAAALYLQFNWDRIPIRFPVHWGVDGFPNRWSERTSHGVYGPLLFGAELCAWLFIIALAAWFGARRSRFRPVVFGSLIATENMIALLFALISMDSILKLPVWAVVLGPLLFIIPMFIVMARKLSEPGDPVEPTPNECWKAGVIYYNPTDAALFVEKRSGLGYTLNFGNRWSWLLILGMMLVVGSAFVLL